MKVEVVTTSGKVKTLLLSPEQEANLNCELAGNKGWIEEYKTSDGEIITDIDIVCRND